MATKKQTTPTNDIIDINIKGIQKKRFRINGDDNKILELNTSDINIAQRLAEVYPKLVECEKEVASIKSNSTDSEELDLEEMNNFSADLKSVDDKMRKLIDYLFNSNVSEICADDGSMYDPINGYLRYEVIIDTLTGLYTDNLSEEMKKTQARMKKHTSKYIKK